MQYTFASGDRVDAIIRADQLVPIDAKFPLDNFERMAGAESDADRQLHEKAFARDVKGHIDAIASKYIRPGEGTYDWALMYLPAEAIYYELVSGKTGALLSYAHDRRVFPVSATTFIAYLQVIAFGLKGLQIERSAQEVIANLGALRTTSTGSGTTSSSSASTSRTPTGSTARPTSGSRSSMRGSSRPATCRSSSPRPSPRRRSPRALDAA